MPRVVKSAARRPCAKAARVTTAVPAPGVMVSRAAMPRKASRHVSKGAGPSVRTWRRQRRLKLVGAVMNGAVQRLVEQPPLPLCSTDLCAHYRVIARINAVADHRINLAGFRSCWNTLKDAMPNRTTAVRRPGGACSHHAAPCQKHRVRIEAGDRGLVGAVHQAEGRRHRAQRGISPPNRLTTSTDVLE
jgi:hypothetical protein